MIDMEKYTSFVSEKINLMLSSKVVELWNRYCDLTNQKKFKVYLNTFESYNELFETPEELAKYCTENDFYPSDGYMYICRMGDIIGQTDDLTDTNFEFDDLVKWIIENYTIQEVADIFEIDEKDLSNIIEAKCKICGQSLNSYFFVIEDYFGKQKKICDYCANEISEEVYKRKEQYKSEEKESKED